VGAEIDMRSGSGWGAWIGGSNGVSTEAHMAESFFQYMVAVPPDPSFNLSKFNVDRDSARLGFAHDVIDATDPDLSAFERRGGKLILAHGWADQSLNPMMSIRYYEQVRERMGAATDRFLRFYMVPGMFHCGGGVGTALFDTFGAVIGWVERGKAPGRMAGARVENGKTVRTRPLCPYPEEARYKGKGSTDDQENFVCAAPSR